jgi:cephalosporin hydroxylase
MIDLQTTPYDIGKLRDGIVECRTKYRNLVEDFHRLWYQNPFTWGMTHWMGVPLLKCPTDLWTYQEVVVALQPSLIIETGTAFGGSALWFAHLLDLLGRGRVVTIDLEPGDKVPAHPRIQYVRGSSIDPSIVAQVRTWAQDERVMVVLDSDHSAEHVTAEMDAYGPMVTSGQFMVIEDTNINGRPVAIDWKGGPGPGPAVDAWLPQHPEFTRDVWAERHFLTMHPGGWLKRAA